MRLQALDGWRGIACLYVALYHLNVAHSAWNATWLAHPEPVLELFFVLSGFVMAMGFADSIKDARDFIAYIIRRFGRVFPLHLFTFGLLLALAAAKILAGANHGGFNVQMRPEAIVPQIFGVQTWVGHGLSWNYPAWTMSAELAAYIVLGLLVGLLRSRMLRLIGAAVIMVAAGSLYFADLTAPNAPFNVASVSRCFAAFFLGFIVYDLWRDLSAPSARLATALQVGALIGVAVALTAHFTGELYFINHLIAVLVVVAFANDRGPIAKLMAAPPLLWLGKLSFSLYMVHAVIVTYLQTAFFALERLTGREFVFTHITPYGGPTELISLGPVWANNLLMLAYMLVVVLSAMWIYRWVEDPSRRVSTDLAKRYQKRELKLAGLTPAGVIAALRRRWTGASQ